MNWTIRNIILSFGAILILYIVGVLSLYIFIDSILFRTERTNNYNFTNSKRKEEVQISIPEQSVIYAALCKPTGKEKAMVLYLHGAQGNINKHLSFCENFTSRGASVLIPDFRGFGKSSGSVTESSLNEDAISAMEWIRKRYREDSIIIYAKDFSANAACYLASMLPCRFVVLENPVYSLRRWMRDRFPALALPYELKYDFNTYDYLPNSISPVYILQSKSNANCSQSDAKKLQDLLKDPNTLIWLENNKNESIYELEQFQGALDQLFNF
ncbi:MAG: alpha/beta fold hydrolase [Saprospiraceae bacterium]